MNEPRERHMEVVKTARYWTLGPEVELATEQWYVLHGYRQLAGRFLRRFEVIDDGTRRIVAPEALSRFYVGREAGRHGPESLVGATWMTKEDRLVEIADYVRYLDTLHAASLAAGASPPTTVLGFSQGVATACRWVVLGDVRPERLVLWGDFVPPDLDLDLAAAKLADVDVVLVRGATDPALNPELDAQERERLERAGIPLRRVDYDGGHEIDAETLSSIATG